MKHKIKGIEISPENRFDIGISIDFEARVDNQKITTDSIVLSREGKKMVDTHLASNGLLEGLPYQIEFAPSKFIDYYVDFTDGFKVFDNKVNVTLKNRYGHDQFFDKAESLIFDLVNLSNPFTPITIDYQVLPQDAPARALTASLGLFTVSITIASQAKEVKERATEFVWAIFPLYGVSLAGVVIVADWKTILIATAKLALSLIFFAILAYQAVVFGIELYRLLNPPLNQLLACTALDLLKKSCNFLGYEFKSSILESDYADMVILPIPQNRTNIKWYDVFSSDYGTGQNKCFPQSSDTVGTLGTLIYSMENMFNGKARVLNKTVTLERWDYWQSNATQQLSTSLVVQADRVNSYEYDFTKLFRRYYIHYLSDYSDYNTIDAFENNLAEYSLDTTGLNDVTLNLIKGLNEKTLPLTAPFFSTTKIFMWDKARGMSGDQSKLTPTYLWDKYHYINNPELYQYIIKRGVRIKITGETFVDIVNKNFATIDGKICEIIKIDYFDEKNYAVIDYKEPHNVFNKQFKLTKIY